VNDFDSVATIHTFSPLLMRLTALSKLIRSLIVLPENCLCVENDSK